MWDKDYSWNWVQEQRDRYANAIAGQTSATLHPLLEMADNFDRIAANPVAGL